MNWNDLLELWDTIEVPLRDHLNGKSLLGSTHSLGIWLAVDRAGNWHLLIAIPQSAPATIGPTTKGLQVTIDNLQIGVNEPQSYIDLLCSEKSLRENFAAFSADVVRSVERASRSPREAVVEVLSRWRRFWSATSGQLSREAALGLFGELWFIYRWAGFPAGIRGWNGPLGSRHDFQWPALSVEVKTCQIRSDAAVHRITSLDQLEDPESGQLYLFSLQVSPDQIASNTLSHLIGAISTRLEPYPNDLGRFLDLLAAVGYTPILNETQEQRLRVIAEELYIVEGDFPKLTKRSFPAGIPPGVGQISYSLSLSACAPWRLASHPSQLPSSFTAALV